jgi:DNA-binding MarR family transcriptional regulator
MNKDLNNDQVNLRSFLLMSELESGEPITQREIAGRVGIALGLVNSYLKSLVQKGFVTVKTYPRNRYAYLLTPKGFSEKSRLAFQHMSNFNRLYRVTRQDSLSLFQGLRSQGVTVVAFCGIDDLTEIFYLSLREAGLQLELVMESDEMHKNFINWPVVSLEGGVSASEGPIVLTALQRAEELKQALLELGVSEERICGPALSYEDVLRRNVQNEGLQRPE